MSTATSKETIGAEQWARKDVGKDYKLGERMTRVVAGVLLKQSGVLDAARAGGEVKVLDSACGIGIVTSLLQEALKDAPSNKWNVTCTDFSDGMISSAKERADVESWKNIVDITIADAQDTKLPSGSYTHVLTSLGFGIFPNSDAALDECTRMLVPGGTLGISTWHYASWPELMQRGLELAGSSVKFPALLDTYASRTGYDWSSVEAVETLLKKRGFEDVVVRLNEQVTPFSKEEMTGEVIGKMSLSMIIRMLPEEDRVWEPKVLPAIAEHWSEMFGEGGEYGMKMISVIATAKKPTA
ncbi:S-adenosyl-L-methionine-dependent methyltransferase [Exidia glandulosa HHB12029]|uniref:S-adenosyl-L-methionine-dependent methyltransferase n=1 Tax=Exidia glandulosa HHB12029 TaxID=1314781 RepID=A0A165KYR7_EXIGL|nr:S-adenosyl-L-methionine-dependent methyltransferase [Exidia glandulosa HHB12029]